MKFLLLTAAIAATFSLTACRAYPSGGIPTTSRTEQAVQTNKEKNTQDDEDKEKAIAVGIAVGAALGH